MYEDRVRAGQILAEQIKRTKRNYDVALGLARGGVIVASEVAKFLDIPLDVLIAKKIGAPGNPEYALGAICGGETVINENLKNLFLNSQEFRNRFKKEIQEAQKEIRRREKLYRANRPPCDLGSKSVLIIDDGLATGITMQAAVRAVKKSGGKYVCAAAPVSSASAAEILKDEACKFICPLIDPDLAAVGRHYREFPQIDDAQMISILNTRAD